MVLTETTLEPAFPEQKESALEDLACAVIEHAGRLEGKVRDPLRQDLVEVTRWMHCYYSNLIEGQHTRVPDIEAALRQDLSSEPEKSDLQQLALAHRACQRWAPAPTDRPSHPTFSANCTADSIPSYPRRCASPRHGPA